METAADVRYRSITISVLVHLALFLALYFIVMKIKIPPFGGGGGVLVNIGYVDMASGEIQPLSDNITAEPQPVKEKISSSPENEKIATQDFEASASVASSKKTETKKTETKKNPVVTETKAPVKEERKVDTRAIYKGKPNSSASQGTATSGPNDQGSGDGNPDSKYYGKSGSGADGPGTGIGPKPGSGIGPNPVLNLAGRNVVSRPTFEVKQETGTVIVEIMVDKKGNVTSANIERGGNTTSSYLQQLALKAARETKFTPSPTGQEIQRGTLTYNFVFTK
jgi:TonB family protein